MKKVRFCLLLRAIGIIVLVITLVISHIFEQLAVLYPRSLRRIYYAFLSGHRGRNSRSPVVQSCTNLM